MKRTSPISGGFTLVEMLIVISIIISLAGLTIAVAGFAIKKGKRASASAEIAAMRTAIESYKADNGDYPRDTNTNAINAKPVAPATPPSTLISTTAPTACMLSSVTLYKALSGDINASGVYGAVDPVTGIKQRVYWPFKPSMLWPKCPVGVARTPVKALVDPFQNVYGYSTIGSDPASTDATGVLLKGYNPTYDLWSTVDPDQTGLTVPASWISNWANY